jgi:hypothetical protein
MNSVTFSGDSDRDDILGELSTLAELSASSSNVASESRIDKHSDDRIRKQINKGSLKRPSELDETQPHDIILKDKSHLAVGEWLPALQLVKLKQLRGNFWRVYGHNIKEESMLHPEEALILSEKSLLWVETTSGTVEQRIPLQQLFELVTDIITLPVYLAYSKLKVTLYTAN